MQKIIVILIVIAAVFFVLRRLFRVLYADPEEGCGCGGCSGCPSQGQCSLEDGSGDDQDPDRKDGK